MVILIFGVFSIVIFKNNQNLLDYANIKIDYGGGCDDYFGWTVLVDKNLDDINIEYTQILGSHVRLRETSISIEEFEIFWKELNNLNNIRKNEYRKQMSRINCDSIKYYCLDNKCVIEEVIYCPETCPRHQLPDPNYFCVDGNIVYSGPNFCGCDGKAICVK